MKTKGFTLVELLVVIAILAILATVSVVGYTQYINNASVAVVREDLSQIRTSLMAADADTTNDFNLTDGISEDEVAAVEEFLETLTVTGEFTVAEGEEITYTIDSVSGTLNVKTGVITVE